LDEIRVSGKISRPERLNVDNTHVQKKQRRDTSLQSILDSISTLDINSIKHDSKPEYLYEEAFDVNGGLVRAEDEDVDITTIECYDC
jgi:hypothetical protein